jgi:hypothetical protein
VRQDNREDPESRITADSDTRWVREEADLELDNNGTLPGGFYIT